MFPTRIIEVPGLPHTLDGKRPGSSNQGASFFGDSATKVLNLGAWIAPNLSKRLSSSPLAGISGKVVRPPAVPELAPSFFRAVHRQHFAGDEAAGIRAEDRSTASADFPFGVPGPASSDWRRELPSALRANRPPALRWRLSPGATQFDADVERAHFHGDGARGADDAGARGDVCATPGMPALGDDDDV